MFMAYLNRFADKILEDKLSGAEAVICMASDLLPFDRNTWYVPAWLI
jgi:hypothetical protein